MDISRDGVTVDILKWGVDVDLTMDYEYLIR